MFKAATIGFCGGNIITQHQRFGIRYWLKAFNPRTVWHCAKTDADYVFAVIAAALPATIVGHPVTATVDAKFKEWAVAKPKKRYDRNRALAGNDVVILAPHHACHYDSDEWQLWHQAWQYEPRFRAILLTPGGNVQTTFNPHTSEAVKSWEYMRSETGKGYVLAPAPKD